MVLITDTVFFYRQISATKMNFIYDNYTKNVIKYSPTTTSE